MSPAYSGLSELLALHIEQCVDWDIPSFHLSIAWEILAKSMAKGSNICIF